MQLYPYPLQTRTFTAGGQDVIPLRDLPKTLFGKVAHLVKVTFDNILTPDVGGGALPTIVGTNNLVVQADFWDGSLMRFQGGFNHMRMKERLHFGGIACPDPDADTADTVARYFRRTLHMGPPQYIGAPSDFAVPCAALENGEIRLRYGALADISANAVAATTGQIFPTAWLLLLDEVRIPPAYSFTFQTATSNDLTLPGRSLYSELALLNSGTFDAIAAGDFGSISVNFGYGDAIPAVRASVLSAHFQDTFARGNVDAVQGEPVAASDDNAKRVNPATPTAVAAQLADLQPVVFQGHGAKITKLPRAESAVRLSWNGAQASGVVLMGRILEQPPTVVGQIANRALGQLRRPHKAIAVKTVSKKAYEGSHAPFMPWKVAL
jgi:hypothetical protein